ncbi:MAG TPA: methyltransferase, partial [Hyphomicrobiaceae bacterium]|nr:methyltransferase [Hyphomicrobiaceae bacterium]
FDAVVLRLPKPRREQEMALHQVLAVTRAGGDVYVYGGNDEGIRSFQKTFSSLVAAPETVAARGHGRVLMGRRDERPVRGRLEDWIERSSIVLLGRDEPWVSYPGLFAAGALDPGTALLLEAMASMKPRGRVLDYGCGPGAIARALSARAPEIDVTLVDNDSMALVAAAQNVPGGRTVLADTPALLPSGVTFDMIVSNPPLHTGVKEDHGALAALVSDARSRLTGDGMLWMVVQRRVPCQALLDEAFGEVAIASDDGSYRVWRAALPKPRGTVKAAGRTARRPRAM